MIKKNSVLSAILFLLLILGNASPALAGGNPGLILRGVARLVVSVFEVPKSMASQSARVAFPFGLATGAVEGALRMTAGTLAGTFDIAKGSAPYAKYLLFL